MWVAWTYLCLLLVRQRAYTSLQGRAILADPNKYKHIQAKPQLSSVFNVIEHSDKIDHSMVCYGMLNNNKSIIDIVTVPKGFDEPEHILTSRNFFSIHFENYSKEDRFKRFKEMVIYKYSEFFEAHFARYPTLHINLIKEANIRFLYI